MRDSVRQFGSQCVPNLPIRARDRAQIASESNIFVPAPGLVPSPGDGFVDGTGRCGATVENLTLTGTGSIDGAGNGLDNTIRGNSGHNVLHGLDGDDTLDGKAGADVMYGGYGDDIYYVDNDGDQMFEISTAGRDEVRSSISHTLAAWFEHLALLGSAAINGTGNGLNNFIVGNSAANLLSGGIHWL
jgi:Ca2+-binding RTX toxin-like protein